MGKWFDRVLRGGGHVGWVVTLITTNWATLLSATIAAALTAANTTYDWIANPRIQNGAIVFVLLLWTWIGILILRDRRRGFATTRAQDLDYGLAYENIAIIYEPNEEKYSLQFGIQLRNVSGAALACRVELDVHILTRNVKSGHDKSQVLIVPFGIGKTYWCEAYPKSEIEEFVGKRTKTSLVATVEYGPIGGKFRRRLIVKQTGDLTINIQTRNAMRIDSEEETAINGG